MMPLFGALMLVLALAFTSLFVGVWDLGWDRDSFEILALSRFPRTLALILTGSALAVAGVIMQQLARNKFVEPTTTGTAESATVGLLLVSLFAPGIPLIGKILIACVTALIGSLGFLAILSRIQLRSQILVPLAGLMYAGVIYAVVSFFAFRAELLQSLVTWIHGDFSSVIKGRYETLYALALFTLLAYFLADRLTLVGLGKPMATSLGVHYRRYFMIGLVMVAAITGVTVATTGVIPFVGLVVPNLVALYLGDNMRKTLPWVALCGAGLVLLCDILGRLVMAPYEISVSVMMGIVGGGLVIYVLRQRGRAYG